MPKDELKNAKYLERKSCKYSKFSEIIMKEKIVLIGGGGHCHSVIDVIEQKTSMK